MEDKLASDLKTQSNNRHVAMVKERTIITFYTISFCLYYFEAMVQAYTASRVIKSYEFAHA